MLAEVLQSEGSHLMVYTRLWYSVCTVLQTGSAQNVGK